MSNKSSNKPSTSPLNQNKSRNNPHDENVPKPRSAESNKKSSTKPDYLKRFIGFVLIFIGSIGCILTSPLLLLGGTIGILRGLITNKDLVESGIYGVKIGSLGFSILLFWGIALANATKESMDSTPKEHKTPDEKSVHEEQATGKKEQTNKPEPVKTKTHATDKTEQTSKPEPAKSPTPFFTKPAPGTYKIVKPVNFKKPEEIKAFVKKVNTLVRYNEAQIPPKKENNLSKVQDKYIQRLITVTKDIKLPESDFWDRLEQMTDKDIKSFVSQLSSKNEKGMHNKSELDYLWHRFQKTEFEPSIKEQKRKKLEPILEALSEEQLKDTFNSANFLNLMNHDVYVETAANILNSEQLQLFALDHHKHDILNKMIKKLKPDASLLSKLMAIMPYATGDLKDALTDQISHLDYPASFNIELVKLAEYYINKRMHEIYIIPHVSPPDLNKEDEAPTSPGMNAK